MNNNNSYLKQGAPCSISDAIPFIQRELRNAGVESQEAIREAELILDHCTGRSLAQRHLLPTSDHLPNTAVDSICEILEGRKQRVPLQYCLGHTYFMGIKLLV